MRFARRLLDEPDGRPTPVSTMVIRPLERDDADELTALRLRNRAKLEVWELDADDPERWYAVDGVRDWITDGQVRFAIVAPQRARRHALPDGHRSRADPDGDAQLFRRRGAQRAGPRDPCRRRRAPARFRRAGLHRVEAGTAVANIASQRVLEHNRFTLVGTLRRHLLIRGVWTDHLLWERLADD